MYEIIISEMSTSVKVNRRSDNVSLPNRFQQMLMNVPGLKQTSVTRTLSVTTRRDSIPAAASVDIRAMVQRVQASYLFNRLNN